MAILVTGGAGYIGSHTAVALADSGHEVVLLDNFSNSDFKAVENIRSLITSEVPFYEVDIRDRDALALVFQAQKDLSSPISSVIHFAALKSVGESVSKPELYHDNNTGGTKTLLEVMSAFAVRKIVFSSSCTVYGDPDVVPVDESSLFKKAESPYGQTKQDCEALITHQGSVFNDFSSALLRYFNPIGAHPSAVIGESPNGVPDNLIPFICQAVAGLRGPLTVFGTDYSTLDGSCVRDYLHVMDLANAHVLALDNLVEGRIRSFNLGTGTGTSVLDVISSFTEATGLEVPYSLGDRREGDITAIWADSSRAEMELGWKAQRSIVEALADAWRWQKTLA